MSRTITIDDTDPGIVYTGSWFSDRGSQDGLGNFGIPNLSTLHGTTSNASFSYTFQGTTVGVSGTQQYENSSAVTNPSWECLLDDKNIPSVIYSYANNRLNLCSQDGLTDGTHTITVNTHITGGRTFWFDFLTYTPSASVPLDNAAISVGVPDPQMKFGTGWSKFSPGFITSTEGSTFNFDFNGISLTWFGFYDAQLPFAATTAVYTVDSGPPTTFELNGVAATNTAVQYNQLFFATPIFPAGPHTLTVTYQGNGSTTPLALEFFIIQNGTSTTTISSASSAASGSSSASTTLANQGSDSSHSTSHVGAIAGAVVGGLVMIFAAIMLFLFFRRREKRSQQQEVIEDMRTTDTAPIQPYPMGGSPPYTSPASSPNYGHSFGNPVVGKRNVLAFSVATGQVSQHSNIPSTSTDANYPRRQEDIVSLDPPSTVARLTPVRNNFGLMHAQNPSISTTNMSDNPSSGPSTSATRSDPGGNLASPPGTKATAEISRPRVTRDEDSGIRMRQTTEGEVVVLPPVYTVS